MSSEPLEDRSHVRHRNEHTPFTTRERTSLESGFKLMVYDEAELGVIVTTVRICLTVTVFSGNILKVLSSTITESISSINLILSEYVIHNVDVV